MHTETNAALMICVCAQLVKAAATTGDGDRVGLIAEERLSVEMTRPADTRKMRNVMSRTLNVLPVFETDGQRQ